MLREIFETPLGPLECRLRIDGMEAQRTERLLQSAELTRQPLPDAEDVDDGFVALVRCLPESPIRQLKFELRWQDVSGFARPRPITVRGTNALRWMTDEHVAVLGTEDVDALRRRMQAGETMGLDAALYLNDLGDDLDHLVFGFHDDGLSIRLTEIPARELVQLHFAVAWNTHPEATPDAAWYAVHRPHNVHAAG